MREVLCTGTISVISQKVRTSMRSAEAAGGGPRLCTCFITICV